MQSQARVFASLILSLITCDTFSNQTAAQTKEFCAKPWSTLDSGVKQQIDDMTKSVINEIGPGKTAIQLWDTRTIPYYVDSGLPKAVVERIKTAAGIMNDDTMIRFVKCKAEVAHEKEVKGFIYIGKFGDFCKDAKDAAACSRGEGMQSKSTVSGLFGGEKDLPAEQELAKYGARVGLKDDNNEYVILHEFIHRLGFAHQHQSPYAGHFITKVDEKDQQCTAATADYKSVYWIPYYDPASVMHYPLASCGIMQLDCQKGKSKYGHTELTSCKVDEVIKDRSPCFYAPDSIKGDQCFKRPAELEGVLYSPSDFGQRLCMSMLDQAWILSRYFPIKQDTYGIEGLIKKGICEAD